MGKWDSNPIAKAFKESKERQDREAAEEVAKKAGDAVAEDLLRDVPSKAPHDNVNKRPS